MPTVVAWTNGHTVSFTVSPTAAPATVPVAAGQEASRLALSNDGGWLYFNAATDNEGGTSNVVNTHNAAVVTVPCPGAIADPNSSCNGVGFVGDTLASITEGGPRKLYTLAPGASAWTVSDLPDRENAGHGVPATPALIFTPDGILEGVSADTSGRGPWEMDLVGLRGDFRFLTSFPAAGADAEVGGGGSRYSFGQHVILGDNNVGPSLFFYQLDLPTGTLEPLPLPAAPAGEFWKANPGYDREGNLFAWFQSKPQSCQADASTCPESPVVLYRFRSGTWQPTSTTGMSLDDTSDGQVQFKVTGNTLAVVVNGHQVAEGITDFARTAG